MAKTQTNKISGLPTNPYDPSSAALKYTQGAYEYDGHYGAPQWEDGYITGYEFVKHDITPGIMSVIRTDVDGNILEQLAMPEGEDLTLKDVLKGVGAMGLVYFGGPILGEFLTGAGAGGLGGAAGTAGAGAGLGLTAAEAAGLGLTATEAASLGLSASEYAAATAAGAAGSAGVNAGMLESVFDPTFGGQLAPVIGGGAESVFDPTSGGSALDAGMNAYPSTGNIGAPKPITLSDAKRALDMANKVSKVVGGNAPDGTAKTAGTAGANTAETALSNLLQQQTSNAALLNFLGGKPELANIKSFKELFGEGLFGDTYVPPSAGGSQAAPVQYADSGTASQNEGEQQLFTGGHVDDFDVDALLQILRS